MKAARFSVISLFLVTYSALIGQSLILRVDPAPDSEILRTVQPNDPALSIGGPVLDADQANDGWMWGEYEDTFTGYLPDQKISKDLLPVIGAIIRAQPQNDARVLTTVTQEDLDQNRITTNDPGLWWEITFTKNIPVFFQQLTTELSNDPVLLEDTSIPAEPLIEESPPIESNLQIAPVHLVSEPKTPPPSANLPTTLTGKLQNAKKRWIFLDPPFPYELIDPSGNRIAYLNLDQALLSQPISNYLNKTVRAYGLIVSNPKGRDSTLRVTHMRSL